jgi:hypothetical protein
MLGPRHRGFGAGQAVSRGWAPKTVIKRHCLSLTPKPCSRVAFGAASGLRKNSQKQYKMQLGLARNCRFF